MKAQDTVTLTITPNEALALRIAVEKFEYISNHFADYSRDDIRNELDLSANELKTLAAIVEKIETMFEEQM